MTVMGILNDYLFQSLGNHEFDNGIIGLPPFIENLTCPVLAANLVLTKEPELEKATNLKKSATLNILNKTIGIIGYITPQTKTLSAANNVEYIDEIVAISREVTKLKKEGVDIIVALGHSGYQKDLEIAKKVEGITLVIGGHTNTFLWNGTEPDVEKSLGPYPTYVTQSSGKQVPVVQAYAYTKYLGKLLLVFNNGGELISASGRPILLDQKVPEDSEVLKIIERYEKKVLNITSEIIGNTTIVLDGLSCQHKECNLGNLITDAMVYRYSVDYIGDNWTDAPIAVLQGGAVRASIAHAQKPFAITRGDLNIVMPFEGNLVVASVNGSLLLKMLEHSVKNLNEIYYPGEFLQVSGLKIVYDLAKDVGSKVIKVEVRCWNCSIPSYKLLNNEEEYNIIMTNFIFQGGDGFQMLKGQRFQNLNYNELSCTTDYIKHRSPVYSEIEGRLTLLNVNQTLSASNIIIPLPLTVSIITIVFLI